MKIITKDIFIKSLNIVYLSETKNFKNPYSLS